MMATFFLETTAVIDLVFKDKTTSAKVRAATQGERATSRYVIFEIARGYVRNLILLHTKASQLSKFSDLLRYLNNVRQKAYLAGTITESFQKYYAEAKKRDLLLKPSNLSFDEFELVHFRGWLRQQIRYGWKKIENSIPAVINPVGCKDNVPSPAIASDGLFHQELEKNKCGVASACGLKRYLHNHRTEFETLRTQLLSLPEIDQETSRRATSMKELYRTSPNRDFQRKDCYSCGDAFITHESPSDASVVSNNRKHVEPICRFLRRRFVGY